MADSSSQDHEQRSAEAAWFEVELREQMALDRAAGELRSPRDYERVFGAGEALVQRLHAEFAASPPAPEAPRRVGPWRLERELGRGGQATVWLAEDTRIARQVALKLFEPSLLRSREQRARLRREAEAAAALNHPAVCTILEVGDDPEQPWIAMRLASGETLARRLARARESRDAGLDPSTPAGSGSRTSPRHALVAMLKLVEEIARGVAAAHAAGIVHRDLKPGNVMISPEGHPVILDFGLARLGDGTSEETVTHGGELVGTPAYMAPDQLRGEDPDPRDDVWALGVILHECLTLRRPFEAPTFETLRSAVLHAPLDVRTLRRAFPRDLVAVLEIALEKDRRRRYESAGAFADDLGRLIAHEPVSARSPGPGLRSWRWAQRHPARATLLLAILVLTAFVSAAWVDRSQRLEELRQERDTKQRTLDEWERLADAQRWRELLRRREALWPARPELVDDMDRWIAEARDVASRLAKHEATLDALVASAAPYGRDDRAADEHENRKRRADLGEELAFREAQIARGLERHDPMGLSPERIHARIDELKKLLRERRTWRFAERGSGFRHRALVEFAASVHRLPEFLAEMKQRRKRASTIAHDSLVAHETAWKRVLARLDVPGMIPQLGLVPLGPDPDSGLEEFVHLETGTAPERDSETGRLRMNGECGLVFILVPGGKYRIGSRKVSPETDRKTPHASRYAESIDGPPHEVTLAPFLLSKYEMTIAQWKRVTGRVPNFAKPESEYQGTKISWIHPVTRVSWDDCKTVLGRLGLDLPTEKQWEVAARARTTTVWSFGDRGQHIEDFGNTASRGDEKAVGFTYKTFSDGFPWTAPIGSFKANPWGFHDVHGNVSEWCRDSWNIVGYAAPSVDEEGSYVVPRDPNLPRSRRGGGFTKTLYGARSSARTASWSHSRDEHIGVRPMRRIEISR